MPRPVVLGDWIDASGGNLYVLESGLKPGDEVIIDGVAKLMPGAPIILDGAGSANPAAPADAGKGTPAKGAAEAKKS
jgi:membrane fusion protein (multidrug efflux system)